MSSVRTSPYAFPHEIARYLAVEAKDVARMIRLDGLPATSIPKTKRTVQRVYLPDFHKWLMKRTKNAGMLADYDNFLVVFGATARTGKEAA